MFGSLRMRRFAQRSTAALVLATVGVVAPSMPASAATLVLNKSQWTLSNLGFINSNCGSSPQIVTVNRIDYRAPSGVRGAPIHVGERFMLHLETAVVSNSSCSFGELFKTTVLLPTGLVPAATTAPAVTCAYSDDNDVLVTNIAPCDPLKPTTVAGIWTFGTSRWLTNDRAIHYFVPVVATKALVGASIQLKSTLTQNKHQLLPSFMVANIKISVGAPTAPGAPRFPIAQPRNAAAVVSWTPPANSGGRAITKYTVVASPGGRTCVTLGSGRSCTVTGLANKTSYTFKVRATNAIGTGGPSVASNAVIAGAPTAPRNLKVAFPAVGAFVLTWTAPASLGSGPLLRYELRFTYITTSNTWAPWTVWGNEGHLLTDGLTGIPVGATFRIQVRAVNASGAGPVADLKFVQAK